jgi:hypothetical protein
MLYTMKSTVTVEAIQWDETVKTMKEMESKGVVVTTFESLNKSPDWCGGLRFKGQDVTRKVQKGDWLVKDTEGNWKEVPDKVFKEMYEPVKE